MTEPTRITVTLTARALAALGAAEQMTDESRTRVVDEAVQLYALLVETGLRSGVTRLEIPWGDGHEMHLLVSRESIALQLLRNPPRPKRRWRPW